MYTYEYDATYLPSMPVVDVAVSSFGGEQAPPSFVPSSTLVRTGQ